MKVGLIFGGNSPHAQMVFRMQKRVVRLMKGCNYRESCKQQAIGLRPTQALQKGINFAISPTTLPIEDIITGVEKAVYSLPVETAEEIRHETES